MATEEEDEDGKGLDEGEVGRVEEVGSGQGLFQAQSELEVEFCFGRAKIGRYLAITILECTKNALPEMNRRRLTSSSSIDVTAA